MEIETPKITHTLYISGKVKDVKTQLDIMTKQFPEATVKEMLGFYNVKEMILK